MARPHRYSLAALDAATQYGITYHVAHGLGSDCRLLAHYAVTPDLFSCLEGHPRATCHSAFLLATAWVDASQTPRYSGVSFCAARAPITTGWGSEFCDAHQHIDGFRIRGTTYTSIHPACARASALAAIARDIYALRAWHTLSRRMTRTAPGAREARRYNTSLDIAASLK